MNVTPSIEMRRDALHIWRAGRRGGAVRPSGARSTSSSTASGWTIGDESIDLAPIGRIVVVGAGKAGAGMAAGARSTWPADRSPKSSSPAGSTCRPIASRPLCGHSSARRRPAGVNEPTAEGVAGSREILRLVGVAGGRRSVHRADLRRRFGAAAGAHRRHHAGRQAGRDAIPERRRRADRRLEHGPQATQPDQGGQPGRAPAAPDEWSTLIISDVLGDPLDLIASGPTVGPLDAADEALAVLERYEARQRGHLADESSTALGTAPAAQRPSRSAAG